MKDLVLSGTYQDHVDLVKKKNETRDFEIESTWWDGDIFCGKVLTKSTGQVAVYKIDYSDGLSNQLKERSSFSSKKNLTPEDVVRLLGIRFNATNDE
ncbi:MAG: hypothetical protein K9J17_02565 [Flavobacteriales bacterium]|nr:hypothetical protein [Flavobacteriales bacterium]